MREDGANAVCAPPSAASALLGQLRAANLGDQKGQVAVLACQDTIYWFSEELINDFPRIVNYLVMELKRTRLPFLPSGHSTKNNCPCIILYFIMTRSDEVCFYMHNSEPFTSK